MTAISTNEQGHFLNDQQKQVKQKIMEDLIEAVFNNLQANHSAFPHLQELLDLFFSILVMFNREILCHTLKVSNNSNNRKQIMKNLFECIKNEVNNNFKNPIPMTTTKQ